MRFFWFLLFIGIMTASSFVLAKERLLEQEHQGKALVFVEAEDSKKADLYSTDSDFDDFEYAKAIQTNTTLFPKIDI